MTDLLTWFTEAFGWLISAVQTVDPGLRNLIAGLALMLETSLFIGFLVPGDSVVLLAATGASDFLDLSTLIGAILLGSLIGESLGFLIGRLFGEKVRLSRLGRRLGDSNWQLADSFIETRGGLAVAISRFLPVLHALVPVTAGMSRMKYRVFIRWTVVACAIWATAYSLVGFAARGAYEQLAGNLKWGTLIAVTIVVGFVTIMHFAKKRLERAAESMTEVGEDAQSSVAGGIETINGKAGEQV
jgi:membrane protein DedA with SNARE-associated domain